MAVLIKSIRGMHDALAVQSMLFRTIEMCSIQILRSFGYAEIRLPLLEKTELYARSIGDYTDIVTKEMYTFEDRNGDSLTLRPEGTAGCVRAALEHGLVSTQQRLWYAGSFFRHERPQKGRLRQFHQVGAETFMMEGPDIDCELIAICSRIFDELEVDDLCLKINSLGGSEARQSYIKALVEWLKPSADQLDDDSRRRLKTNPLRILDSKNADMQKLLEDAPRLSEYIDDSSRLHLESLKSMLEDKDIAYQHDPFLVRGLDYYNKTVFEWVAPGDVGQTTVCAGGRYDGLVALLGGKQIPAAGFALGIERLALLLEDLHDDELQWLDADIYMVAVGEEAERKARFLSDQIRELLPTELVLIDNCGGGSFKAQLKRADKSGASVAIILGEDEVRTGTVTIKDLRGGGEQSGCKESDLLFIIQKYFPLN